MSKKTDQLMFTVPTKTVFKKSLWNPWQDGVTQSFLRSFRTCRETTRLKFVEGWSSRSVSSAIEFGSCFHWVLSQIYTKLKPPTQLNVKRLLDQYHKTWAEQVSMPTTKQTEQQELVYAQALPVLMAYIDCWKGDWTGKLVDRFGNSAGGVVRPAKWLNLEDRFAVPFTFDDGATMFVKGCFDGVFEDKRGGLWLFETKTKSYIDEDGIEDMLPLDIQVLIYLWALWKRTGRVPKGVLYNVVRRPGIRLLDGMGLGELTKKIEADVTKPNRKDYYFIRWQMETTGAELEAFVERRLRPMMAEVRKWWEGDLATYINDDALFSKFGRSDMYEPLVYGSFSNCYRRKTAFNELVDFAA